MRRLLIRPGALGDLVVSLPALEHLRAEYTEVWVPRGNVPLIRFADRVRAIEDTGISLMGLPDSEPVAAVRGFASIVSWYGSALPEFREQVQAVCSDVRFFPALPPAGWTQHATEFYREQAGGGTDAPSIGCPIVCGGYVAIHPFSGSAKKNWPLEKFRAVAEQLPNVQWCAGPDEELTGAVRFADRYELACWLAGARLYIGNDSGVSHLAAAVGTPTIAVFGPTDPAVWGPRGRCARVVRMGDGDIERVLCAARFALGAGDVDAGEQKQSD